MGTFHQDLDRHTLVFSPELEHIFGLPAMSFGSTFAAFQDLVHPEDRAHVLKTINYAIQHRSAYDLECRILRQDPPEEAWIAITGQVLPDSTGHPRQITGVMFDITERKHSVTAPTENSSYGSSPTLPGLIASVDCDERYRFVNAGCSNSSDCRVTRLWGFRWDLSTGLFHRSALHPAGAEWRTHFL